MLKHFIIATLLLSCSLFAKTKIACVGDSITFGSGVAARERLCYPAQLSYLLGDDYEVRNFGVGGRTMLNKGDHPYTKEEAYQDSLAFEPNIIIIKLGTNDSKPHNWKFKSEFVSDAELLVKSYAELPSKPRIILCQPVPVVKDRWGITENITRNEVAPLIREAASNSNVELIDMHPKLIDKPEWLPDGVHPNAFGAEVMARSIFNYLKVERDETFETRQAEGAKKSQFHGYSMQEFKFLGADCKLVSPKVAAEGNPWIWRARFWDHEPQFDVTMLELGWHIVYCDVANLFGSPKAVARWDKFYYAMQSIGLSKKPVLEGMSRGGLIIHNWAVKNPNKVDGIIGDNCVMDFKSWPAGYGASEGDAKAWKACAKAYGLKSEEAAKAYKENPIDTIEQLKDAGIPLLYLIGTDDKVVPAEENAQLAVKKLADYAEVILKEGKGHHPHSLPNPQPIVDFALRCNGTYINPASYPAPSAEFRGGLAGWGGGIWWNQLENINKVAKQNPDLELIFFGDSISQSWTGPKHRVANPEGKRPVDVHFGSKWKTASFGISGDRTEHLLFRLKNGNFEGLKPKAIVLMIGVNNILARDHSAAQVAEGIEALVEELSAQLPDTHILLLGPFPAGKTANDPRRKTIANVHESIAPMGEKENVTYLNLAPEFIDSNGNLIGYSNDAIHLKKQGYEIWAKAILPSLEKVMQ